MKKQQKQISERKKILIVIGPMGHGKSAFINSLICPAEEDIPDSIKQELVEQRASLESVTYECCLRKINECHNLSINGEPICVIDTPGIDSESAPCLISQQIDNMIMQHKCDIIGIAYIINIGQRQIGSKNKSKLKQFLNVLKIPKQIKNELIFFVLSKWDEISRKKKQDALMLEKQFIQLVSQAGIVDIQSKVIKWVNKRCIEEDSYQFFMEKKGGVQIQKVKFQRFAEIVRKGLKSPLSFESHMKNTDLFWQRMAQFIQSEGKDQNIRYEKQPVQIYYDLQIKLRDWDVVTDLKNVVEILLRIPVANIIFLFYSIGTWLMNNAKSVPEGIKGKYKKQQGQVLIKSKLKTQIQSKIQSIILCNIIKNIKMKKNNIVFQCIQKQARVKKLLTYYNSSFTDKKIPLAFLHQQELKQTIQINIDFVKNSIEKATIQQDKLIQKFIKEADSHKNIRVPKNAVIYVKDNQQVFVLKIKTFCRLPEEACYGSLVREVCMGLFGVYK